MADAADRLGRPDVRPACAFQPIRAEGQWLRRRPLPLRGLAPVDLCEQRLAAHPFIGGNEYTIADMAFWPWLRNTELLGVDLSNRPHVAAWVKKIAERDAVKRALAKVATITSSRDTATDDNKDRFFGRGKYARTA